MQKKCYYAHSMALYDTEQEKRDVALLESLGFEVINPNSKAIQEVVESIQKQGTLDLKTNDEIGHLIMEMFKEVVKQCQVVAFRSFVDFKIGAGVMTEILTAELASIPVIELPNLLLKEARGVSVNLTRTYLQQLGQR